MSWNRENELNRKLKINDIGKIFKFEVANSFTKSHHNLVLTSEAVGHVDLELDIAEQHRQGHGEVSLRLQRDVTISGLKKFQRRLLAV